MRSRGFIVDLVFSLLGDAGSLADLGGDEFAELKLRGLRVTAGSQEGLPDGWHDGQPSVYPGGLEFVIPCMQGTVFARPCRCRRRPSRCR